MYVHVSKLGYVQMSKFIAFSRVLEGTRFRMQIRANAYENHNLIWRHSFLLLFNQSELSLYMLYKSSMFMDRFENFNS